MRRQLATTALVAAFAALAAAPALAGSGGATAPDPSVPSTGGGAGYGDVDPPRKPKRRRPAGRRPARRDVGGGRGARGGPVLTDFELSRSRLYHYGRPVRVRFQIDGSRALEGVRLRLVPVASDAAATTIRLGPQPRGEPQTVRLTGRQDGVLSQGAYRVRIRARDARGRGLRRRAGISSTHDLSFLHHRFPVVGAFSYGNAGSRFGAPRSGHLHQGHDLAAREGTPVVAPRGGTVKAVQYQASGAGHYIVLGARGEDRDYVFMHLRSGSIVVREGQRVRTGQRLGEVGNTGRSFGAHLHFEIWTGGGWYTGGRPIDPLPFLRAWPR